MVHGYFSSCRGERDAFFCLQILCSPSTTHWVSHSPLTKRVVPTKAFLMNTVSAGRRHSSCTRAWNLLPFQPKEQSGIRRTHQDLKDYKIKEENVDLSSPPHYLCYNNSIVFYGFDIIPKGVQNISYRLSHP